MTEDGVRNLTMAETIRRIVRSGRASLANTERIRDKKLKSGTLVLALKYDDGIVVAADRMMVSGWDTITSMSEKKIMPITDYSVIGYSGSVDVIQVINNAYFHLLNLNTHDGKMPAVELQVNLLHTLLREFFINLGDSWLWTGTIFAAVDPTTKEWKIAEFSGAARIDREFYAAIGCGGGNAMATFEKHKKAVADGVDEAKALAIVFEGLFAGALSTGVSHPKLAEPIVVLITKNGMHQLTSKEIHAVEREAGR